MPWQAPRQHLLIQRALDRRNAVPVEQFLIGEEIKKFFTPVHIKTGMLRGHSVNLYTGTISLPELPRPFFLVSVAGFHKFSLKGFNAA